MSTSPPPPLPQFTEHPYTDIPGLTADAHFKPVRRLRIYLPLLILLAFLPVITGAVLLHQYLSGSASNIPWLCQQKIASVRINPGKIETFVNSRPTQMSTLAYDSQGRPIWKDVTYEWGMSSSNTIGNIIPQNLLAVFKPQNPGIGSIFVTGSYCGRKATGSALVTVSPQNPINNNHAAAATIR